MINKLSSFLSYKLYDHNKIREDEIDLYSYGLFILISQILLFLISVLFGLILSCAFESIVLYISFQSIRKFAGGYHASTETRCEIMSTLSVLICIALIRLSKTYDYHSALLILTILATVCIFVLCPLDTEEKPLTDKERTYFRKVSHLILLGISTVVIFSAAIKNYSLMYPACLSLAFESILLVAGKIKQIHLKEKDDREQSLRNISPG
jgi:accessory gene regulator B